MTLFNGSIAENKIIAKSDSPAGDWLSFSTTVAQLNFMLDTEFATFKHEDSGETSIRTMAYSIPTDLVGKVELVHPTVTYVATISREAYANSILPLKLHHWDRQATNHFDPA